MNASSMQLSTRKLPGKYASASMNQVDFNTKEAAINVALRSPQGMAKLAATLANPVNKLAGLKLPNMLENLRILGYYLLRIVKIPQVQTISREEA